MSIIAWNYDVEAAKSQGKVLACADHGDKVDVADVGGGWIGFTWWHEDEQRWVMLGSKQSPLCWAKPVYPEIDAEGK